jgi:hypothetical protein
MRTNGPRRRSILPVSVLALCVAGEQSIRSQEGVVHDESCVQLMNETIRYGDEIVLLPSGAALTRAATDAIERWRRCDEYESAFPRFVIGEGRGRRVKILVEEGVPGPGYCGRFEGDAITLYRLARVHGHRIIFCPATDRVLAHELGHVLGLRDIEATRGCPTFMMSEVVERRPTLQRVARDECRAVDRKWETSEERDRVAAKTALQTTGDGQAAIPDRQPKKR